RVVTGLPRADDERVVTTRVGRQRPGGNPAQQLGRYLELRMLHPDALRRLREDPLARALGRVEQIEAHHALLRIDDVHEFERGAVAACIANRPGESRLRGSGAVDADDVTR